MAKLIHIRSKIFFTNPYVVRVEYVDQIDSVAEADYRQLTRSAYKHLHGTWGYSPLLFELIQLDNNFPPYYGVKSVRRAYFCFQDKEDALQFRLSLFVSSIQVHMWPENTKFTIHEVQNNILET